MTGIQPDMELGELERSLSELALSLFAPGTVDGTLQRIVDLAVAAIEGCDAAGVMTVDDHQVVTTAASDPLVTVLDRLQFDTGEGPCLDAVSGGGGFYAIDLAGDERWLRFGPAATAAGIRCILAFRLSDRHLSSINLYARLPAAFSAHDRAKGSIFATLAGLALDSAERRGEQEKAATNLHQALKTRELIGQAQGILMERERITAEHAFDVLRRASQNLNTKLSEVAQALVETGQSPDEGSAARPR